MARLRGFVKSLRTKLKTKSGDTHSIAVSTSMMTTGEVTSSERTISIKRTSARDYLRRLVKAFRRTKSSESVTQSSALNTELTSSTYSLASTNNGPGSVSSVATVTTGSIQPEQNATSIVEDVEPRTYGPAPSVPAPPAQFLSYLSHQPKILSSRDIKNYRESSSRTAPTCTGLRERGEDTRSRRDLDVRCGPMFARASCRRATFCSPSRCLNDNRIGRGRFEANLL